MIMNGYDVDKLISRYPVLVACKESILEAYKILIECFSSGHKLLIAGNGGSSADADHIVGELMKGFKNPRKIDSVFKHNLINIDSTIGLDLSEKLQQGLPAIALNNHSALNTAFINDVENGGSYIFAQQILGYGNAGDVFLGISTSGNAQNIYKASVVAKAKGMKVICLSGKDGGLLKKISDTAIIVASDETFVIQELHLPIYHCLCLMIENYFFSNK